MMRRTHPAGFTHVHARCNTRRAWGLSCGAWLAERPMLGAGCHCQELCTVVAAARPMRGMSTRTVWCPTCAHSSPHQGAPWARGACGEVRAFKLDHWQLTDWQ